MRKLFFFLPLVCLMLLVSCQPKNDPEPAAQMTLTVDGVGAITSDTTLLVTEAFYDATTRGSRMDVSGTIAGVDTFCVTMTRSAEDRTEEFCAAGACKTCNGKFSETMSGYALEDPEEGDTWFAHYYPGPEGDYTVVYKFCSGALSRSLTIIYSFTAE